MGEREGREGERDGEVHMYIEVKEKVGQGKRDWEREWGRIDIYVHVPHQIKYKTSISRQGSHSLAPLSLWSCAAERE